ncbi:DUF3108 domain-containing protein [Bradyrhizobium neotropicale]|uniref:DUF3108 domain-containing protein n=1 Tax=Bradyrhizobium neotropicale TaxID=1497615 RepID=UPI001AD7658B|nr:DUF3108 domain-containing protein [Bradyrhizobium neotropicale]MBO4226827.1 DUF3108 domain-containing protein [Bradyrhizobium neotropicale]
MNSRRISNKGRPMPFSSLAFFWLTAFALTGQSAPTQAETFNARYQIRLTGISIGSAQLSGDMMAGAYTVTLKGDVSLLGFSARFEASSDGLSRDAAVVPARYRLRTEGTIDRTVTVNFSPDRTAAVIIDPALSESEKRGLVPLDALHRKNVIDPMSALISQLLRMSPSDAPCAGVTQVFTGSSRFDVNIIAGSTKADEIECRAVHQPIAGHKPSGNDRPTIAVIAFPKTERVGGLRLPTRIEVPLSLGTITVRRVA